MASINMAARRAQRMKNYEGANLSSRAYNGVLCGTLLYGLVINFILCLVVGDITTVINPAAFLIAYVICCIVGCVMSAKSHNPVMSFIGYNLVVVPVGLVISMAVQEYGGISSQTVIMAFLITMCITAAMTFLGIAKPEFCSKLGGLLFAGLLGLIIAELFIMLLGMDNLVTSWFAAGIFSLYIAYDVYRSQSYPPTVNNAIDSALDIYLDVANLFMRIMRILGKSDD